MILSRLFRHKTLPICFERFNWSLAIGHLVSTNTASLLWTYEDEKFNTSNVMQCPAQLSNSTNNTNFTSNKNFYLMLTKIIKENDIVKENAEDFYGFLFSLLFYSYFSFTWHLSILQFVKKWTGSIVSNSLFLQEVIRCYERLWEFFVTKPISYKYVFVNSSCSASFRHGNSVEPFLWLII